MPIATPTFTPRCHGYILTSQHPSFPSQGTTASTIASDPYDPIPCPFEPSVPICLSEACRGLTKGTAGDGGRNLKTGCAKGSWCERHWCGKCKRARVESEGVEGLLGLSHGVVQLGQVGESQVQEVQKGGEQIVASGVTA